MQKLVNIIDARRNSNLILLVVLASGNHFISFLLGIHPSFMDLFLCGACFWFLGFIFSGLCLFAGVRMILQGQKILKFALIWILFTVVNFVPGIFSSAAGALTTLYLAGPENVVEEGRELIMAYESPEEVNCDLEYPPCGHMEEFPPAIEKLNPIWVRVFEDRVVIKKFGLGDVAGFVIFPEGVNPPGFKLYDGLYWIDAY